MSLTAAAPSCGQAKQFCVPDNPKGQAHDNISTYVTPAGFFP
jgi:hypothetical protein